MQGGKWISCCYIKSTVCLQQSAVNLSVDVSGDAFFHRRRIGQKHQDSYVDSFWCSCLMYVWHVMRKWKTSHGICNKVIYSDYSWPQININQLRERGNPRAMGPRHPVKYEITSRAQIILVCFDVSVSNRMRIEHM